MSGGKETLAQKRHAVDITMHGNRNLSRSASSCCFLLSRRGASSLRAETDGMSEELLPPQVQLAACCSG